MPPKAGSRRTFLSGPERSAEDLPRTVLVWSSQKHELEPRPPQLYPQVLQVLDGGGRNLMGRGDDARA